MVYAVKTFADVSLDNPAVSCVVCQEIDAFQRHRCIPHGAETIGMGKELCFLNKSLIFFSPDPSFHWERVKAVDIGIMPLSESEHVIAACPCRGEGDLCRKLAGHEAFHASAVDQLSRSHRKAVLIDIDGFLAAKTGPDLGASDHLCFFSDFMDHVLAFVMGQTEMVPWVMPRLLHPQVDHPLRDDLDRVSELAFLVVQVVEIVPRRPVGEINVAAVFFVSEGQLLFLNCGIEAFQMRFTVVRQHTDVLSPGERLAAKKAAVETGAVHAGERGLQICGKLFRLLQRDKVRESPLVFDSPVGENDVQPPGGADEYPESQRLGALGSLLVHVGSS